MFTLSRSDLVRWCRRAGMGLAVLALVGSSFVDADTQEVPPTTAPAEVPHPVVSPSPDVPESQTAAVLSFEGEITDVMASSLKRRIEEAQNRGVGVIVLDMDTPGGLVSSSIAIADMMRELTDIKTVAWVNPNAHSGGSIVAVACDEIVMTRSSRIGDSQVIMGGPGGAAAVPEDLQAKAYTPVLAEFRQSAKQNGYSHVLCESFVLPDREVWWIEHRETGEKRFVFRDEKIKLVGDDDSASQAATKADAVTEKDHEVEKDDKATATPDEKKEAKHYDWKLVDTYFDPVLDMEISTIQPVVADNQLLEMSAGEAMAYGFNKAMVRTDADLKARYHLSSIIRMTPTWSESLAYWLTSMYVRGFLLLLVALGTYVEFNTPGVGVPGLVAIIALTIFVGAPYLTGLADIWEIILLLVGFVLLGVEVFVIPGFGVAGISGIVLILVGLLATFVPTEPGHTFPIYIPTMPATMRFVEHGIITMASSLGMSIVGMYMLSKYLPKTMLFRRIVPANPTPSEVLIEDPYRGAARVGDLGSAQTVLRPSGKALFGPVLVDVVTRGEMLDAATKLEVIERRGNQVVVRAADSAR